MKVRDLKDLNIWLRGIKLVETIYQTTSYFPKEEKYGLTIQMKRSAVSVPSNIAEGFTRYHNKEYKQFLYISKGSCAELRTQIEISFRLDFIDKNKYQAIIEEIDHLSRMIQKLINCL